MGFLKWMLGNLMGGHHGSPKHGVVAATVLLAPNAAAPMRSKHTSVCNEVLLYRVVNVPVAARSCRRASGFAASTAKHNSNAARTPLK